MNILSHDTSDSQGSLGDLQNITPHHEDTHCFWDSNMCFCQA